MHSFSDTKGRVWSLDLNLGTEAAVHRATKVYLSDISGETTTIDKILTDNGLFAQVIVALCTEQMAEADVTYDDFVESLKGEAIDDARDAIVEEVLDFLGRRGATIRVARRERMRIEQELEQENLEGLKALTGSKAFEMLGHLLAASTATGGNAAASVESTPEVSDLENSPSWPEPENPPSGKTQAKS